MFAALFAMIFGKKRAKRDKKIAEKEESYRHRFAQPMRVGKSSRVSSSSSSYQSDDIMSNPLHPLNPIGFNSSIYHDSTPSYSSHSSSYDCGSSSLSSYDSGSSSSCDSSSSSSSSGGD